MMFQDFREVCAPRSLPPGDEQCILQLHHFQSVAVMLDAGVLWPCSWPKNRPFQGVRRSLSFRTVLPEQNLNGGGPASWWVEEFTQLCAG